MTAIAAGLDALVVVIVVVVITIVLVLVAAITVVVTVGVILIPRALVVNLAIGLELAKPNVWSHPETWRVVLEVGNGTVLACHVACKT